MQKVGSKTVKKGGGEGSKVPKKKVRFTTEKFLGSKPCISTGKSQKSRFFGVWDTGKKSKKWGGVGM